MTAAEPGVGATGLARGLAVTLRTMTRRAATRQYPDVPPDLPPRSRGVIALFEENCTVCMLCARECPDWCIYIDSHKETVEVAGGRARQRNVLDRFGIDFALCMYCGICIEVCPFDALFWSPEFEYAEYDVADLTHERDRLREWMWTVPPPPALDPAGQPAKEVAAAAKAAEVAGGAATERPADRPTDRSVDRPADRATDRPADRPADRATDRSADRATDGATERPADRPADRAAEVAGGGATEPPADWPADRVTERPR